MREILFKRKKKKFISIQKKVVIVFVLCFIVMISVGSVLMRGIMMKSFDELEITNVKEKLLTTLKNFNNKLSYINMLSMDWGAWDDTYYYVQGDYEDYIQCNLTDDVYMNYDFNLMMFTNASGEVVYSGMMDLEEEKLTTVNSEVINYISKLNVLNNTDPDYILQGIIMLPDGPMLIATYPILRSDYSGPVKGNVIFGRYLDSLKIEEMSNELGWEISAAIIDSEMYKQIQQLNNSSDGFSVEVLPLDSQVIEGTALIPDLLNQSAVKLIIKIPRDVHNIGYAGVKLMLITLITSFFIVFLALLFLINKVVLSRISKLHKNVVSITENKDISQRVTICNGHDEICHLSMEINNMLDVTEKLNQTVQKSHDDLELIVEERTVELIKVNEALTVEQKRIKHIAYHDSLTGLPNGLHFSDYLNRSISSSSRLEEPLAILFLDLDGFKMINDTLGHSAGDHLLKLVSNRLTAVLRKSDFIARIGGDEFIVLIDTIKSMDTVDIIAKKILKGLDAPFLINKQECFISASIGIAIYPIDGGTSEELLKNADLAMYKAKDNGRSQYCFCNKQMKDQVVENMVLSNQLWRALERQEFELYYQPQINCKTNEVVGIEALIRWNHPEHGMVMPEKFIPLAEQTGAIITIGEWVLNSACKQCKIWQDKYYPELRIAVNVSIKQLQNRGIVGQVEKALKKSELDSQTLELEITESIFIKEVDYVVEILKALKDLGADIAIDDFGTEYASMRYLKLLPVDRIKIAMQFVQGIDVNEKDQAITKSLIILAKNMGMSVIAEGVETKSQRIFLTQKQCDEIQGFYFYKPLPVSEMEKILKDKYTNK